MQEDRGNDSPLPPVSGPFVIQEFGIFPNAMSRVELNDRFNPSVVTRRGNASHFGTVVRPAGNAERPPWHGNLDWVEADHFYSEETLLSARFSATISAPFRAITVTERSAHVADPIGGCADTILVCLGVAGRTGHGVRACKSLDSHGHEWDFGRQPRLSHHAHVELCCGWNHSRWGYQ